MLYVLHVCLQRCDENCIYEMLCRIIVESFQVCFLLNVVGLLSALQKTITLFNRLHLESVLITVKTIFKPLRVITVTGITYILV